MTSAADRAVACGLWEWSVGMVTDVGQVVVSVNGAWLTLCAPSVAEYPWPILGSALASACRPNLSHPATRGCVLGRLREVWREPSLTTHLNEWSDGARGWCVCCDHEVPGLTDGVDAWECETEEDAMVAALEVAKERKP